jgi:hypothetical protein
MAWRSEVRSVALPEGREGGELLQIVGLLTRCVPEQSSLIVDITFTLRHLGIAYLAALVYLSGLRRVAIEKITYGALELSSDGVAPIIDVTPAYHLLRWYHAAATVRETGDLRPLQPLVRELQRQVHEAGLVEERKVVGALGPQLEQLAVAHLGGFCLKVAEHSLRLDRTLAKIDRRPAADSAILPLRMVVESLRDQLASWIHPEATAKQAEMTLSEAELERELVLVEHYIEHQNPLRAVQVLGEWLINLVILRSSDTGRWLDHTGCREQARRYLNGISELAREGQVSGTTKELAKVWKRTAEMRNSTAHAGFRDSLAIPGSDAMLNLVASCRRLQQEWSWQELEGCRHGRLLVTPFGLSPGLLLTAVHHVRPDRMLVITSAQGLTLLPEAVARAGFSGDPDRLVKLVLGNPWSGYDEVEPALNKALDGDLLGVSEVVVNLTGGTSLLGFAAQRMGEKLQRFALPVRRVALVDRRSPEEQRENPYVVGEMIEMEQA